MAGRNKDFVRSCRISLSVQFLSLSFLLFFLFVLFSFSLFPFFFSLSVALSLSLLLFASILTYMDHKKTKSNQKIIFFSRSSLSILAINCDVLPHKLHFPFSNFSHSGQDEPMPFPFLI